MLPPGTGVGSRLPRGDN